MDGGDTRRDQSQENAGWQYKPGSTLDQPFAPPDGADAVSAGQGAADDAVEWSASEFVAHEKNFGWYAALALVTALVSAGLYLVTRDTFTVGVVAAMAVILGIAAARKPRVVAYRVDNSGITVGRNFHSYREYKSFAIPEENGPFASIVLVPMKRFGIPLSAYLAPDSQQKALEVLSGHLPMERGKLDAVDQLMRQLRF